MKIIDNFFSETQLKELTDSLEIEITNKNSELYYHGQNHAPHQIQYEENDHEGLENCRYYRLTEHTLTIMLQTLYERNIITHQLVESKDCMLKYHVNRAPYMAKFHKDGLYEKNNKLDYIGMTIFLNDWQTQDGGLFIYKSTDNESIGTFIEPKKNRIIINPEDLPHAVTQITNPLAVRKSLQFFMNVEHLM
jgi:hypothetical protein